MATIFKKGDKVFDYAYGWGEVTQIRPLNKYPIRVEFENNIEGYTFEGQPYYERKPTLSFTEYTLQGFSQERPIELPKIGEMVMVSDYGKIWILHKVTDIVNGKVKTDVGIFNYFERLR